MRNVVYFFLLSSCTPSIYYVVTDSTFEQVDSQYNKRKIIYLDQGMGALDKLDSMATSINKRRWKNEHEYSIGKNVIKEDLSKFLKETLITEANRSTTFYADSVSNTNLTLEIEIDSIGAKGPYRSNGYVLFLLFAYSYSMSESAGPGLAYSKLNFKLRNNDKILMEGHVRKQVETEPLVNNFKSTNELRRFFTSNLTEALSFTLKSNIEAIVKKVEVYCNENIVNRQ